jgi:putative transcriptional regulator
MKNSVKVLRAERDWTQAQLAAALEVSRQTVNAIETGKIRSQSVPCLSSGAALGLSIEEIFDR